MEAQNLFPEPRALKSKRKKVDPKGYKVVSVRLREGEFETLSQQTTAMGMTNNMALRIAARRISGFLELDRETRLELQAISDTIGYISDDLRELLELCATRPGFDNERFSAHRADFAKEFMQLDRLLRALLSVSRRRTDGCKLLRADI